MQAHIEQTPDAHILQESEELFSGLLGETDSIDFHSGTGECSNSASCESSAALVASSVNSSSSD